MRILKVTQAYYPFLEKGGPPVKVRAIARGLRQRGHEVTVLTVDFGFEAAAVRPQAAICGRWGWQAELDGIQAIYLSRRAWYRAVTWNPGVWSFCRERLRTFDLVHIYGLYDLLGPVVAQFCRRWCVPYVVEPMGMFRPIARSLWLKRLYHLALGSRMIGGAQSVVATAEQEHDELVDGGVPERKIVIRRNGIDAPEHLPALGSFRRRWKIPAHKRLVLFLGRLVSKKSPELLLEAFARWRSTAGPLGDSMLVIAGSDEGDGYRRRLETFSARLGLEREVVFTGPLYDEAKWAAYRDADVFVLPSQSENFGNAAAEAIACGTPVMVTDRCGIAPLVNQRAGLVVPYDRTGILGGLTRLLQDETLRRRLQAGCDEVTRSLSWDEPVALMETLYAQLMADAHRR